MCADWPLCFRGINHARIQTTYNSSQAVRNISLQSNICSKTSAGIFLFSRGFQADSCRTWFYSCSGKDIQDNFGFFPPQNNVNIIITGIKSVLKRVCLWSGSAVVNETSLGSSSSVRHDLVSHLTAISVRRWHHSTETVGVVVVGGVTECSPH